ncbi:unnamed protein product, partial [Brassica oleracea]
MSQRLYLSHINGVAVSVSQMKLLRPWTITDEVFLMKLIIVRVKPLSRGDEEEMIVKK